MFQKSEHYFRSSDQFVVLMIPVANSRSRDLCTSVVSVVRLPYLPRRSRYETWPAVFNYGTLHSWKAIAVRTSIEQVRQ